MSSFVDLGVIKSKKGLKGEVKVKAFVGTELFEPEQVFFLSPPIDELKTLTVESIKQAKSHLVIKFKEITSAEKATKIQGHFLQVSSEDLPPDFYSPTELIGAEVNSKDGEFIGNVMDIEYGKAHDFFVVKSGSKKVRIAAVKQMVLKVDIKKKKIVVDLPKGLTDIEG